MWLHESGVLAATPDGIVKHAAAIPVHLQDGQGTNIGKPQLLEVKCPYTARYVTVAQAVNSLGNFYLGK
jgi:hypothetical protein